jgi:exodeoxyribonuclease VIII
MTEETTAIDPAEEQASEPAALPVSHEPGIYYDISNEEYHSGDGISKSGLWTIGTKTPAHFKFPPPKDTSAQARATKDFGTAVHTAILEPEKLETSVYRGPADRKGNKWTDCVKAFEAGLQGMPLTEEAYDRVLTIRDRVHSDNFVNQLLTCGDGVNEATGYVIDPVTGQKRRVRPDRYRRDLNLIIDVKTTESAMPDAFARSVINYGYHAQEAYYTDAWQDLDQPVDGFLFLAWEKKSPFAFALFELPPEIVEEGRAIMRRSLNIYHECQTTGRWPGYASEVQQLQFKRWHFTETEAPEDVAA